MLIQLPWTWIYSNANQQVTEQQVQSSEKLNANQYIVPIDRLANIFRYVNHPEAIIDTLQKIWSILKSLFGKWAWYSAIVELLYKACKFVVRTCQKSMAVIMGDLLHEVQMQYKIHNQSCFHYLASELIKVFGSDPSYANYLGGLIAKLFGHTKILLKTIHGVCPW